MVITDRFVFLHLHKSGGTFVNECLMRFLPDARQVGYHLPRTMIPSTAAHLPVLGLVRNPWSYYVSWYNFQRAQLKPNVMFRTVSDGNRLNFEETIRNMLDLGSGSIRLDILMRDLPASYSNQGLNLPGFALAPIRGTRLGFYSYLYRYLYGGANGVVKLGRMEALREELPKLLQEVNQPISDEMSTFIADEAPRNASQHSSYRGYYSDALRDLVAERDAEIVDRHAYRFDA
jgi:hypothetical protein